MKKFIHVIGELKFLTAIYFMAFIMLNTIVAFIHGTREFSIITIWEMLIVSGVFGGLHFIQTSGLSLKIRIPIHLILAYITVIVSSLLFNWGFAETPSIFWQFTAIFIVIYALIFLSFSFYYKNEEVFLNKKLEEYKIKNK